MYLFYFKVNKIKIKIFALATSLNLISETQKLNNLMLGYIKIMRMILMISFKSVAFLSTNGSLKLLQIWHDSDIHKVENICTKNAGKGFYFVITPKREQNHLRSNYLKAGFKQTEVNQPQNRDVFLWRFACVQLMQQPHP